MTQFLLLLALAASLPQAEAKLPPAVITAMECRDGKIRTTEYGKKKEAKARICFDKSRTRLVSADCQKNNCAAVKMRSADPAKNTLPGEWGSPAFKYCYQTGGDPEIMDFFDGKKWWSLDRCRFPEDGSFVNAALLYLLE